MTATKQANTQYHTSPHVRLCDQTKSLTAMMMMMQTRTNNQKKNAERNLNSNNNNGRRNKTQTMSARHEPLDFKVAPKAYSLIK